MYTHGVILVASATRFFSALWVILISAYLFYTFYSCMLELDALFFDCVHICGCVYYMLYLFYLYIHVYAWGMAQFRCGGRFTYFFSFRSLFGFVLLLGFFFLSLSLFSFRSLKKNWKKEKEKKVENFLRMIG